jgi:hypothetical protein
LIQGVFEHLNANSVLLTGGWQAPQMLGIGTLLCSFKGKRNIARFKNNMTQNDRRYLKQPIELPGYRKSLK